MTAAPKTPIAAPPLVLPQTRDGAYQATIGAQDSPATSSAGNGFEFDNQSSLFCNSWNWDGAAAVLTRSTREQWNHPDTACLSHFTGQQCGEGIVVKAVDWRANQCSINGTKAHGIDVQAGSFHDSDSHFYGVSIASVRVRPGVTYTNLKGTRGSDAPIGFLIQGPHTRLAAVASHHCTRANFIIGAQTTIDGASSSTFVGNEKQRPDKPAIVFDFANRIDPDFGGLCGNWSTLAGADIDLLDGDEGLHIESSMCRISRTVINGPDKSIGVRVTRGINPKGERSWYVTGTDIDVRLCGAGVVIDPDSLGENCHLNFDYYTRPKLMQYPPSWPSTTTIRENGITVPNPGGAAK